MNQSTEYQLNIERILQCRTVMVMASGHTVINQNNRSSLLCLYIKHSATDVEAMLSEVNNHKLSELQR